MTETAALWALAVSAFTSATVLPGTSELGLLAFAHAFPQASGAAFGVATLANTVGGLTSYALGRLLPTERIVQRIPATARQRIQRFGPWALLLSWVPVIGDALVLAAGALRVPVWSSALALLLGKAGRYALLLGALRAVGIG